MMGPVRIFRQRSLLLLQIFQICTSMTLRFYSEKVWKINGTLRAAFRSRSSRHDQWTTALTAARGRVLLRLIDILSRSGLYVWPCGPGLAELFRSAGGRGRFRPLETTRSLSKLGNVGGDVPCLGSRQIHIRHLRMWVQEKGSQPRLAESWPLGNLLERWRVSTGLPLSAGYDVARRAPALR